MSLATLLDLIGIILGLAYIYLEMQERAFMWVIGMIMPAIYTIVLYEKGIYGDAIMELYYFLASVYGLLYWLFGKAKDGKLIAITRLEKWSKVFVCLIIIVLWGVIYLFLKYWTDSSVPIIDAATTAGSVVALWLLSRKYIEQWWIWFVVDFISTGLYIYKGIYGRAFLYCVYCVLAVYGYNVWKRRMDTASSN